MITRVGQTRTRIFNTRNSLGVLYDPVIVQASFLKSPTVEDVLTYGGVSAHDDWLTRLSAGRYQVSYTFDVAGETRSVARWSDDSFVTCARDDEFIYQVYADPHGWADTPIGPIGMHYVYYGVGVAGIHDAPTLEAMSKDVVMVYDFTATLSPSNQKIYICHPASWNVPTISLDGFPVDLLTPTSVMMHDYDGSVVAYKVYESTQLLTGTADFAVRF
jgi:hypothetical protein